MQTCQIEGCDRKHYARGWCNLHWERNRRHGDPLFVRFVMGDDVKRFHGYVEVTETCWLWRGQVSRAGYGQFRVARPDRMLLAHRWSYAHHVGPIPEGLELDHLCRVRQCVNPAHLEPVTPRENQRRSRSVSGLNAAKTCCVHGHPFDASNTRVTSSTGERRCRTCARELTRAAYYRKRGRPLPAGLL